MKTNINNNLFCKIIFLFSFTHHQTYRTITTLSSAWTWACPEIFMKLIRSQKREENCEKIETVEQTNRKTQIMETISFLVLKWNWRKLENQYPTSHNFLSFSYICSYRMQKRKWIGTTVRHSYQQISMKNI